MSVIDPFPGATGPGGGAAGPRASWWACLVLILPAMIPYLTHYFGGAAGTRPTGFICYDMAYYLANAREHFDGGSFRWTYGNPYDPSPATAPIYFQPMILLLALAWRSTGIDPGALFVAFGFLAAMACARVATALYRELVGLTSPSRWLGLVILFWGGGLLAVTGIVHTLWAGVPDAAHYGNKFLIDKEFVFRFDPAGGWWFLNFGRNLIFPTEAFYHALFLGAIYAVIRGRFALAAALAAVSSASHPFTGIELLSILLAWSTLEVVFLENRAVPRAFPAACLALIAAHVGYYLVYLSSFPEHKSLAKQWTLDCDLEAVSFIPAYALVGGFALWSLRRYPLAKALLAESRNRLFLAWFLVVFALTNHEFAFRPPMQQAHFTRGYDWLPLFFLAAPGLVAFLDRLLRLRIAPMRVAAVAAVMTLFVADNAIWLGYYPVNVAYGKWNGDVFVTRGQEEVLDYLSRVADPNGVVVAQDHLLNYLSGVYTPLRPWSGHASNTPRRAKRQGDVDRLFQGGQFVSAWGPRTLHVAIINDPANNAIQEAWLRSRDATKVLENPSFRVYRIDAAPGKVASGVGPRRR